MPLPYLTDGGPGRNRTCGQWFRKPLLYPLSYRASDGAPGWIRTSGLRIRSPSLYPLSYGRTARNYSTGHLRSQLIGVDVLADCDIVTPQRD